MNVLDPFEVFEVEMWPHWEAQSITNKQVSEWKDACAWLDGAEFTVFQKLLTASSFKAVLNEKNIAGGGKVALPASFRASIIPKELQQSRKHPDVRIARRASTIASLAKVISERDVSPGLRRTLHTQARRLERLAGIRFAEFSRDPIEFETDD